MNIKEMVKDNIVLTKVVDQDEMEKLISDEMPYRILCKRCGSVIVASDEPIIETIKNLCEDVPCSNCVVPDEYRRMLNED